MLETFFCSGFALTVYLIFLNIEDLSSYAWPFLALFFALLLAVAIWAVIVAIGYVRQSVSATGGSRRGASSKSRSKNR